jgi:hypothetical protein
MKKFYLAILAMVFVFCAQAQLTGTKTIPGDYASIAAAVTDLNAQGVGAGGVIFQVNANHTETSADSTCLQQQVQLPTLLHFRSLALVSIQKLPELVLVCSPPPHWVQVVMP